MKDFSSQFKRLFQPSCERSEAYDIFRTLDPAKLSVDTIHSFVSWIEATKAFVPVPPRHVNIFGTGGDSPDGLLGKTLNISSLAAIIASHAATVVKIGTRAVTAKWGSEDFFAQARSLHNNSASPLVLVPPSKFVSLRQLGFPYSDSIIHARRRLFEEGHLDLFKIVFPIANFTNSDGQVNGVSRVDYLAIYSGLASKCKKTTPILLVYNERNHDELLPGRNILIFHYLGEERIVELNIEDISMPAIKQLHERDTIAEQVAAAESLFQAPECNKAFIDVMCLNAATLLCLNRWQDFSESFLVDTAAHLKDRFLEVIQRDE